MARSLVGFLFSFLVWLTIATAPVDARSAGRSAARPAAAGTNAARPVARVNAAALRGRPILYVSDSGAGKILMYAGSPYPTSYVGEIDNLKYPEQIAVDRFGTLYICEQSNVVVYRPGVAEPIAILSDHLYYPTGVAVDSNEMVYVTSGDGTVVVEFAPGSSRGNVLRLPFSGGIYLNALAVDRYDNLYLASALGVFEKPVDRDGFIRVAAEIGWANGIGFDHAGDLFVDDGTSLAISKLRPFSSTTYGQLALPVGPPDFFSFTDAGPIVAFPQTYYASPKSFIAAFRNGATTPYFKIGGFKSAVDAVLYEPQVPTPKL